jgi:cephalosporin-C deacetylase
MPVLDFPLEELKTYRGVNPRPDDFEEYWDKALEENSATDPDPELVPADFPAPQAECYDLFFTGVGGARIHARYLRPKSGGPHPALLGFHGYSGRAGDWSEHLRWPGAGFCYAGLDCRGQGGLSEDPGGVKGNTLRGHLIRGLADSPEKLYFRSVFLDTVQLGRVVRSLEEVDGDRLGALGGSQGGGLTLACAALDPEIKAATPVFPFLSDYRRVWEMDLDQRAYEELRAFFRMNDPNHRRAEEIFRTLGYIDVQHLAPRIRAKVLMAITQLDEVCPPSTQFAAYNKIRSEKEMLLYPDFGHEGLPEFADHQFQFFLRELGRHEARQGG